MLITLTLTHPWWETPRHLVSDMLDQVVDGVTYTGAAVLECPTPPIDKGGRAQTTLTIGIADPAEQAALLAALVEVGDSSTRVAVSVTWWEDDGAGGYVVDQGPAPFLLHAPQDMDAALTAELRSARIDDVAMSPHTISVAQYPFLRRRAVA